MGSCCGRGRREKMQATSPQVAAQQAAERQAQKRADDLALTVQVAAEEAVAAYAAPDTEDIAVGKALRNPKRRARAARSDDE